jgi:hypothetical protein
MSTAVGTDVERVLAVATDYVTSFYSGTAEERTARVERVLHPLLAKRSQSFLQEDGAFHETTYLDMGRIAARSVNEEWEKSPYSVKVLDMTTTMASVRTDADWGVDYMHLVKIDGEWKIVNVLWDKPDRAQDFTEGGTA